MEAAAEPTERGEARAAASCPQCDAKGRKVGALTIRALLSPNAIGCFDGSPDFLFCKTGTCNVVYFHGASAELFRTRDLTTRVFHKSTDPARLVCYCFGHTVDAVRDDVAHTGTSGIADDIVDKCRQGLDRCAEMNPQGSCCLRNVRQIANAAVAEADTGGKTPTVCAEEVPTCCGPKDER